MTTHFLHQVYQKFFVWLFGPEMFHASEEWGLLRGAGRDPSHLIRCQASNFVQHHKFLSQCLKLYGVYLDSIGVIRSCNVVASLLHHTGPLELSRAVCP